MDGSVVKWAPTRVDLGPDTAVTASPSPGSGEQVVVSLKNFFNALI
jgi:hypothetical protein